MIDERTLQIMIELSSKKTTSKATSRITNLFFSPIPSNPRNTSNEVDISFVYDERTNMSESDKQSSPENER